MQHRPLGVSMILVSWRGSRPSDVPSERRTGVEARIVLQRTPPRTMPLSLTVEQLFRLEFGNGLVFHFSTLLLDVLLFLS